jgi:3-phosphoshikimate 1-carboxyvinyltransferase
MKWIVSPSKLHGTIAIPPSKSHTIRSFLVATLAGGTSTIRSPLLHGDGRSAMNAAKALGATLTVHNNDVAVQGIGGKYEGGSELVDCGNSGTSTCLFTSAAALGSRARTFDGDSSLRSRPVRTLLDGLKQLGASYTVNGEKDVPFTIRGPIRGGKTTINGLSSQYVSSLLFSCPLAPADTEITVVDLHEKPYVELSLWWLDKRGIEHSVSADFTRFTVRGRQSYKPIDLTVPADFSSATFAAVAASLTGSPITLTGLDFSDPQGDRKVFDVLERFGAKVERKGAGVTVFAPAGLKGREVDLNAMPDALPALSVLGCMAEGVTRLTNVAQARIKETDRIAVMARELRTMGADVTEESDGIVIRQSKLTGARVHGHDDHRVVMALALAGMVANGETIVETAESADVTYPSFVHDFATLGARIKAVNG